MTTRADVSQRLHGVVTEALYVAAAERRIGAPGVIPAVAEAERDLIQACRRLVAAVDDLPAGDVPSQWRPRERKPA
jgi:tetrahydromethanopterin S-methyltransferase subunit A